jgi:hypothetical protein
VVFTSFPRQLFKPATVYDPVLNQDVFIWEVDINILRGYISKFQAGDWPSSSPFETPEPGTSRCE